MREDLLNKSVLLRMFKPKRYQDRYQLNSTSRSAIFPHHFFAALEANYRIPTKPKHEAKTIHLLAEEIKGQDQRTII